jgi:hypothetical protein
VADAVATGVEFAGPGTMLAPAEVLLPAGSAIVVAAPVAPVLLPPPEGFRATPNILPLAAAPP